MRWSEDGSEVILAAAEFNSHIQSMAEMAAKIKVAIAQSKIDADLLKKASETDVNVYRIAELSAIVARMASEKAAVIRLFENFMRQVYQTLDYKVNFKQSDLEARIIVLRQIQS